MEESKEFSLNIEIGGEQVPLFKVVMHPDGTREVVWEEDEKK